MKQYIFRLYILPIIWVFSVSPVFSQDVEAIKDSLVHALTEAKNIDTRLEVLTNLSDLTSGQKDPKYSNMLWKEAIAAGNNSAASAAMIRLLVNKLDNKEPDSLAYYAEQARVHLKAPANQAIPTYYEMIAEARKLQGTDSEVCKQLAETTMNKIKNSDSKTDKYEKMKNIYIIICCIDRMNQIEDNNDNNHSQALYYAQDMLAIAQSVPFETGGFLFVQQALMICCKSYSQDSKEYVDYTLQQLNVHEKFLKLPSIQKRPYYSQRVRIRTYAVLATAKILTQQERDEYFEKVKELLRIYPSQALTPPAAYYQATIGLGYYYIKGDYARALQQTDTLLKYNTYPLLAIRYKKSRADLLYKTGNYKDAYPEYVEASELADSLSREETQNKYLDLQTLYEVNETKLKNAELQQHNQLLILAACIIVLLLLASWGCYNYYVRRKMQKLNTKIQESEAVKSAFLHSMCHEIRTPLNIISGFSTTILLTEPDEEEKESLGAEIERQTLLLTKMLDDILEVSNLDASNDTLPIENTDIHAECKQAIHKFSSLYGDREWVLDTAHMETLIQTNRNYFNQLIDNLLSNAAKFSQPGACTTLSYIMDEKAKLIRFSVTDTGIGIPEEKHKWVFGRFTKLDDFTQGAGLGLYICRLIVKRMDGKIYIDKTYKQGTRVVFEIPVSK